MQKKKKREKKREKVKIGFDICFVVNSGSMPPKQGE